jgi:MFS family permease
MISSKPLPAEHATAANEGLLRWVMVLACAGMVAMGFGAIVNMAVFFTPLATEFGWSRGELSLAYSAATIATGIGGIAMGHFSDRVPIRWIALCGAVFPAVALIGLSRMTTQTELYAYHALMGLLGIGAIMAPLNTLAGQWMHRNPGLAIGVVSAGGALGQGLVPFIARDLVLVHGWRSAYVTMGIAHIAIMLPLAFLIRNVGARGAAPSVGAQANPYSVSRKSLIAWLCVAVTFCCVCMGTPIVHVAALGSQAGLAPREAAGLLTVMMVFGMGGRVAFGKLADRFGNLRSYIVASAGQTVLAFMFPLFASRPGLYVLSALFGLVYSGAMTSFILCAREYAESKNTGLAIGTVMFFGWLGMAVGGWQGGLFYDLCGSYDVSFANASWLGLANLSVLALLYVHTIRRKRTLAAVVGTDDPTACI